MGQARNERTQALTGLSVTALGVAAGRAAERQRPDRLFDDPLAEAFVAAGLATLPPGLFESPQAVEVWRLLGDYTALRTRFLDDRCHDACAAGCQQVVLLAAGLDTRAFRLDWPAGTQLFELDLPELLAFKERVLTGRNATPGCRRVVVEVDLLEDWTGALTLAGFDPGTPTAWIAEGLLPYLAEDASRRLLARAGELSAPGSHLAVEYVERLPPDVPQIRDALTGLDSAAAALLQGLWKVGTTSSPEPWLADAGWRTRVDGIVELAATYQRPTPPAFDPERTGGTLGAGFVTAQR